MSSSEPIQEKQKPEVKVLTIPTASAVANAVANALGVRVNSLPITPARVLAALGKDISNPVTIGKPEV